MKSGAICICSLLLVLCLSACDGVALPAESTHFPMTGPSETISTETVPTVPETTTPEITEPSVPETVAGGEEHSDLYIQGLAVENVTLFFNEVCLDSEFVNSGDPSYVQKWVDPIYYMLEGDYSDDDVVVIENFAAWLNTVEGFPGMYPTTDPVQRNLQIHFCDQQEIVHLMGRNFSDVDGGVTFWYLQNEIYDAIICIRSDLPRQLRTSVILEEIYNGLGPVQDTNLRPDSIIYQAYSEPQELTPVDELLLRLLYHPDILPGMDAQQCEQVIHRLYY
jgi:hypothetical protein